VPAAATDSPGAASSTAWAGVPWAREITEVAALAIQQHGSYRPAARAAEVQETVNATPDVAPPAERDPEAEIEADSFLDNAKFLSFEEWKKQNLARAGQSPESIGQGRAAHPEQRGQRRPVNVNALDSLGEDSEIEIDFSGFGSVQEGDHDHASRPVSRDSTEAAKASEDEDKVAPSNFALSKDAGKTCKERFNYASFDCAATVLKTNPKASSSTAILVENKDSYMLNECSQQNKFLIVELCDDILVDTVVLANYEFFSSQFRHFRVSVSDRYPVKLERWRTLATFEARNSRDIQPFLITEPQIWARYLRIEFLSHYGTEFYCPVSLLRVHGTTMMEQFRREEEEARGDDDFAEPIEAADGDPVETAVDLAAQGEPIRNEERVAADKDVDAVGNERDPEGDGATDTLDSQEPINIPSVASQHSGDSEHPIDHASAATGEEQVQSDTPAIPPTTTVGPRNEPAEDTSVDTQRKKKSEPSTESSIETSSTSVNASDNATTSSEQDTKADSASGDKGSPPAPPESSSEKATAYSAATNGSPGAQSNRGSTATQPNPSSPTTQESFFKSIHKRLQYLESNSTLSVQYIEEQSRTLREAFMGAERRQMRKTEAFLDHLNKTVMQELKSYRNMYDQLWQSVIMELDMMKERQRNEIGEIGARLSLVADELVWQKKMAVVQSTLLLLCLGLVLFVRSGTLGPQADGIPVAQQLGNKYSRFFDSPPRSPADAPGLIRRRRTFRNMWRSDTSIGLSERSGQLSDGGAQTGVSDAETDGRRSPNVHVESSPPTPDTPGASSSSGSNLNTPSLAQVDGDKENRKPGPNGPAISDSMSLTEDQARRIEVLATQSGPATPRGSRDTRPSWEEVDRAVDRLRAEEQDGGTKNEKKERRSPLRRAESYDDSALSEGKDGDM
jgi:hypothetical protein